MYQYSKSRLLPLLFPENFTPDIRQETHPIFEQPNKSYLIIINVQQVLEVP